MPDGAPTPNPQQVIPRCKTLLHPTASAYLCPAKISPSIRTHSAPRPRPRTPPVLLLHCCLPLREAEDAGRSPQMTPKPRRKRGPNIMPETKPRTKEKANRPEDSKAEELAPAMLRSSLDYTPTNSTWMRRSQGVCTYND